jgi:hypothetical protein
VTTPVAPQLSSTSTASRARLPDGSSANSRIDRLPELPMQPSQPGPTMPLLVPAP